MYVDIECWGTFELDDTSVASFRQVPEPWGFGTLSNIRFERTTSALSQPAPADRSFL